MGFNEQGSSFDSRTRYVQLDDQTRQANAQFFLGELPPVGAITQGIGNILESMQIVLVAKGESKAWGIHRALEGPIDVNAPASFLRLHPHVTFLLDRGAASLLGTRS
jgi:glucosamine-6-phosphate deaminase